MAKYISNRQQNLKIGIVSYTEDKTVLEVTGNVGIKTADTQGYELYVNGDANISGIVSASSFRGDGSQLTGVTTTSSLLISANTDNQSQYLTYVTGTGSTTGFGITTTGLVFNPSTGNLGIGTTNPTSKLHVVGNVYVSGIATLTQISAGGTVGTAGSILSSTGSGLSWIPAAPAGGITVRDSNNTIVGTSGSVTQLTFSTGFGVTGTTGVAGIATITLSSNIVGTSLSISGISTFSGITTHTAPLFGTVASFSGVVTALSFSGNASSATFATNAGIATNLKGGVIGNIPYQSATDTTAFLTNGGSGTILQSNGVGNAPTWVAAAPAGAVSGLVIRDSNNTIIGSSGSVTQLTFSTGFGVTGTTGVAGIATITLSSNIVGTSLSISGITTLGVTSTTNLTSQTLNVSGISTFTNGPILVGTATSTGTASQRLQVTGGAYVSGSVGIGTTNPQDKLEINSLNDADVKLRLANSASSFNNFSIIRSVRVSDSQSKLEFQVNNAGIQTCLIVDYGGIVYIGQQSSTKLIVTGNSKDQPNFFSLPGSLLNVYSNTALAADTGGSITLGGVIDASSATKAFGVIKGYKENATASDAKGYLSFLTNTGSSISEALRITSAGNLLIGTATSTGTASQKLQVDGGAYVSGNLGIGTINPTVALQLSPTASISNLNGNTNFGTTAGAAATVAQFYHLNGNASYLRIKATRNTDGSNWTTASTKLVQVIDVTEMGYIEYNPNGANYGMAFGQGGSEWARFLSGGNLGIGTTNPTSKLHVVGNVLVSGIITSSGGIKVDESLTTKDLNVIGIATIATLGVSGLTTTKDLNVIGIGTIGNVKISSNTVATSSGNLTIDSTGGTTTIDDILSVTGNVTLGNDVNSNTVSFGATVSSHIIPSADATYDLGSTNSQWNNIFAKGTIKVDESLTTKNLNVLGIATIGTLGVTGLTTTKNLNVTGIATIGTLGVSGLTTTKDLNVLGIATIGTLGVSGLTTTKDLNVLGIATIATLGVTGLTTTKDLNVLGIATIGNVKISSNTVTTSSGNLTIDSTGGTTTIDDILSVTGNATFNGSVTLGNDVNSDTVSFGATVSSHIIPSANTHNLGSETLKWGTVYATAFSGPLTGGAGLVSIAEANQVLYKNSDNTAVVGNAGLIYNGNALNVGIGTTVSIGGDAGRNIELGIGATNIATYIDFYGSAHDDYSARIIRDPGLDGNFIITNKGAGNINLATTVSFGGTVSSHIIPSVSGTHNLGSNDKKWGTVYATQFSTGASGTGVNITTDTISGPAILTIDPAAVGDDTGAVRIKGDLYVDGTQFIVNSTTIELADFNVGIATTVGTNDLLDGAGIGIGSTSIRKTLTWSNGSTALKSSEDFDVASGKVYKVNGTSVLSSDTLGSGIVNSSLTSVGTLGSLSVGNVYSTGISTLGVTSTTNLTSQTLNVSGISTLGVTSATNLTSQTLVVSGISTLGVTSTTNLTSQQLNVSGVSTLGTVKISSGIVTATTGIITYFGDGSNLTGLSAGVSISTSAATQSQFLTFVAGTGTTTGFGVSTTGLVFNPSTGNLGIGTTNPLQKAHILGGLLVSAGSSTTQHITQKAYELNSGTLSWEGSAGQLFSITNNLTLGSIFSVNDVSGIPSIDVDANGTVSMVSYGGSVGIGTTLATQKLHVQGNVRIAGALYDVNNNVGTAGSVLSSTGSGVSWIAAGSGGGGISSVSISTSAATQSQFLTFVAGTGTTTGFGVSTTGLVFNPSTGNLGIGTTNPQYSLQVQGNARITGALRDSTNSPGTSGQVLQSTVTGTQWAAAGGGSGKFDTTIDNVLYFQPTGTLDIIGVGQTTTQITTLPSGTTKYLVHSLHVTNVSNGDAEITAGFIMNARKVPATISVSIGQSGGAGIHTFTVGSASSITVGMAVTGTGNIGETTGIGSTAGFQFNTYVTSVNGTSITLSKPMSGRATGTLFFSPVSLVSSRLPVPVGSAVELLKQPMVLNALDSIVLQSTGAGSGIGSTSTAAITQAANSNFLTVTAGAAITNFLASGMLIQPTGSNTGIQTNTFVGVGYTPGTLSIPMTKPATVALASTSLSFTEVITPQDGALQVTVVYQSSTDTSYQNGTGTVVGIVTLASLATSPLLGITSTTPSAYYGTGIVYPSIIQSIRVSNISDSIIYPGGDYSVSVGIGNSDTIFSYLAYNMVIPRNSSIELCESPKIIGIGQSIFAFSNTPNAIEIQIAGKRKTT